MVGVTGSNPVRFTLDLLSIIQFSSEGIIIFSVLLVSGLIDFIFVWIFNNGRKKIIQMNHAASASVVDIIEKTGLKGNKYYESTLRYQTVFGNSMTVISTTFSKPGTYTIGDQVELYYNPDKPDKFVLKKDPRVRLVNIGFICIGTAMIIAAVFALILM